MTDTTLKWKDHHSNLCGMFEKLFEESVFVDCTLAAEGKYVNVHKAILSAVSPYFELIFTQESENNPIVILTDIKFRELKAMLDFIYRGKVTVSEEYLEDFVCAAESLQIKGLGRDYIKYKKQDGTAMTNAQELSNQVSHTPLNQHQRSIVSGNENCGTETLSSREVVDEKTDFLGISAVSSQMDPLNSSRINPCSTSADIVDTRIPRRLTNAECEMKSISTSKSLGLETLIKCEPTTEDDDLKMEFVQCKEEWLEPASPNSSSPSEGISQNTSSSRLVPARGLQTDPLDSCEPNLTSSVRGIDKSDQNSLDSVSSHQLQEKGKSFISVSTLSSTSYIDKRLEINPENLVPKIEFSDRCEEFVTEESAFDSESCTSETAGAGEEEVAVKVEVEVDVEADAEEEVSVEEGAPSLACVQCGKVFDDSSQLNEHTRTHAGDRPSACHLCGKDFKHPSLLTRHLRTHTGERPYACHLCGEAFAYSSTLTAHLRTHTGERPFACHLCGKSFPHSYTLTRHLRTHTGERPYACPTCGKAFGASSTLKEHLLTHTGERPFACELCGMDFLKKSHLTLHVRTHTGERPYACSTCGKTFKESGSLKEHLRTHTGERPFVCPTCGKAFGSATTLKQHVRIHKGERPFACHTCGKAFTQSSSLKTHLRAHTGERPYACHTCGKAFKESGSLKEHLRIHTGERPFACEVCGKAFRQASALAKHQRTHTRASPTAHTLSSATSIQQGSE